MKQVRTIEKWRFTSLKEVACPAEGIIRKGDEDIISCEWTSLPQVVIWEQWTERSGFFHVCISWFSSFIVLESAHQTMIVYPKANCMLTLHLDVTLHYIFQVYAVHLTILTPQRVYDSQSLVHDSMIFRIKNCCLSVQQVFLFPGDRLCWNGGPQR